MQIFHGNEAVIIYQFTRKLVLEIVALVEYVAMQLSNKPTRLTPASRPLGAAGYVALHNAQFLLGSTKPTWVVHDFRIAGDSEGFQANIYAHNRIIGREWFCVHDARETGIPLAIFVFQGERFYFASKRAVQLDFHIADFR